MSDEPVPQSSLILYQTEDGRTRIQCRLEDETLWLTQAQMAELFQTSVPNINLHLKAIYAEGELVAEATIKSHLMVRFGGCAAGFPPRPPLQPACHSGGGLPRAQPPGHAVPAMGHRALE